MLYSVFMITEEQKYVSGILKNLGFAFLSPIGAIVFQYLIFEKGFSGFRFLLCVLISSLSWMFFYMGYNKIKETKNVKE